ncbi:MAG: hypothetical protein J6Y68_03760 [Clostridia bacterium]|nr:hypothetical protein [Clostridia bacterium]
MRTVKEEHILLASSCPIYERLLAEIKEKKAGTYLFDGQDTLLSLSFAVLLACSTSKDRALYARRFSSGNLPDVLCFGSGGLKVEDAEKIASAAQSSPLELPLKFFIIEFAGANEIAQNKLLKILEDVPKTAMFFLITPSFSDVLPTIRSRSKTFSVSIPPEKMLEFVKKESSSLAKCLGQDNLTLLEGIASGEMLKSAEGAFKYLEALGSDDSLLRAVSLLPKTRDGMKEILSFAEKILGMIVAKLGGAYVETFAAFNINELSEKFTLEASEKIGKILRNAIRRCADANLTSLSDITTIKITEVLKNAKSSGR